MEDQNQEEIKESTEKESLVEKQDAEKEAREEIMPAAPKRKYASLLWYTSSCWYPCWFVLAGWQVVGLFVSIFVYHYLFISSILRLCLVAMRVKEKIATIYFWLFYLIGGFAVAAFQQHFFPLFQDFSFFLSTTQKFFIRADVLLFWLYNLMN